MGARSLVRCSGCILVCTAVAHVPGEAAPLYAFTSDRDGELDIFVVDEGGGLRNVTRVSLGDYPPYSGCSIPSWSPDGTRIAFSLGGLVGEDIERELYVIDADGTSMARLTNSPGTDWYPSWSPDGTRIAFCSHRDGNYEIYAMNADGSGEENLTLSPSRDCGPAWSPDGMMIAFRSDRDGVPQIYLMAPDGFDVQAIPGHPVSCASPTWHPDGTRLAFSTRSDIRIVELDGSEVARFEPGYTWPGGLAWSPDGSEITFEVAGDYPRIDIHSISVETGVVRSLTDRVGRDFGLSWFPGAVLPTAVRSSSWGRLKRVMR